MRASAASIFAVVLVAAPASPAAAATFTAPVEPPRIEAGCDYADDGCLDPNRRHAGVDYLPNESPEPVLASADGIVRIVASENTEASHDFGNVVVLEHTLAEGARVSTVYGHLRDRPDLRPGDCVRRGSRLESMGSTGSATNVHLHFEVKTRPTLGPPYGYTSGHPGNEGFFDPKDFIGRREAVDVCSFSMSDCAAPKPRAAFSGVRETTTDRIFELRVHGRVRRLGSRCRVQVALLRRDGERCAWWRQSRRRVERRACESPLWTSAQRVVRDGGVARWSHGFRARIRRGDYEVRVRLVDPRNSAHVPAGVSSTVFSAGTAR